MNFYHVTALCPVWFLNFHPEDTFTDVLRTDLFSLKSFMSLSVIKLAMFEILFGHFYFHLFRLDKKIVSKFPFDDMLSSKLRVGYVFCAKLIRFWRKEEKYSLMHMRYFCIFSIKPKLHCNPLQGHYRVESLTGRSL